MTPAEQPESALSTYGRPVARVVGAFFTGPLLLIGWWGGRDCVDDPCDVTRGEELRGLLIMILIGGLILWIASSRYKRVRYGIWLLAGVPGYLGARNLGPETEGPPIRTDAPELEAIGLALLSAMVPVLLLTLVLELIAARKRVAVSPDSRTPELDY